MNATPAVILPIVAGVAFLTLVLIGAMVVYDAVADDDMMGDMWHMMDGGMMDGGMMGGRGRGNETRGSASGRGAVRIADFEYEPSVLDVTPGTVVTWTNEDSAPHTATSSDEIFDTDRLDKGETSYVTFETPGTYDYICAYHPYMEGSIIVSASLR